jgi:hypothetical protein
MSAAPKQCPKDGGFIGSAGCTHPNHEHSELVKRLLAAGAPRPIDPADCDAALREGFYVNTKTGERVGFGPQLVEHLKHHSKADQRRRKRLLPYAIKTVTSGKRKPNPQGGKGSWKYAKWFEEGGFGLLVLTDAHGDVEDVFDIIPKERRSA